MPLHACPSPPLVSPDWKGNQQEKEDVSWKNDWDDEEFDDDFCKQLRAELERNK